MSSSSLLRAILVGVAVVVTVRAAAAFGDTPVLELGGTKAIERLAPYLQSWTDCTGPSSLERALSARRAGEFAPTGSRAPNHGYSSCVHWLWLEARDPDTNGRIWLLLLENATGASMDVYVTQGAQGGASRSFHRAEPWPHRFPAVRLGNISANGATVLVRAKAEDVAAFPLELAELRQLAQIDRQEEIVMGLFYGAMLFAILFSSLVAVYLRDGTSVAYAAFLACLAGFEASVDGVGRLVLWAKAGFVDRVSVALFCGLTIVTSMVFASRFLRLRQTLPAADRWFRVPIAAGFALAAGSLFAPARLIGALGSVFASVTVLVLAGTIMVSLRRRVPQSGYFVLACGSMCAGVLVNAGRNFGLLPATLLTSYGHRLGAVSMMTLLSCALVARFARSQQGKAAAERRAWESRMDALTQAKQSAEFKLQALQAQINPHFLFNTLSSVAGLIAESPERAREVVLRLATLFRHTLDSSVRRWVTLEQELSTVRLYLELQKMRFEHRLQVEIDVDPLLLDVHLPGLLLQPLVENAVKHGLQRTGSTGNVRVAGRADHGRCRLTVEDDGIGMTGSGADADGHGLRSVRERLRLAYDDDFEMELGTGARLGLRIDISIPMCHEVAGSGGTPSPLPERQRGEPASSDAKAVRL